MMRCFVLLALIALACPALAGEFNKKINVGDPSPVWKDLPGTDGKKHSLADVKDKDVVVVVFTCNSCPIALDYEDRIIAFGKKYAGPDAKVALVGINVNTIAQAREAGVDWFVCGSAVFDKPDRKAAIVELRAKLGG